MTFSHYLNSVRLWIADFSDNVIDLDDLPDVVDIGECYADEIPARECAGRILIENNMEELVPAALVREYWLGDLNEDSDCGYFYDGTPIGG